MDPPFNWNNSRFLVKAVMDSLVEGVLDPPLNWSTWLIKKYVCIE